MVCIHELQFKKDALSGLIWISDDTAVGELLTKQLRKKGIIIMLLSLSKQEGQV